MPKQNTKALNKLSDLSIDDLTLCKNPAVPIAGIQVRKSEDIPAGKIAFNRSFTFKSTDPAKKQVFLYYLEPNVADLQGDIISPEDVEKACHSFMKNLADGNAKGKGVGVEHSLFKDVGYPIQSAMDYDGSIGKAAGAANPVPGGWWVGIQCTDAVWELVEKGELTGGSIGGTGLRTPIETSPGDASLAKKLIRIINPVKKEGGPAAQTFDEAVAEVDIREKLWDFFDALRESIWSIFEDDSLDNAGKATKLSASIEQFKTAMVAFSITQKAIGEMLMAQFAPTNKRNPDKGGNTDMNPEITKAIADAIAPLNAEMTDLKKKVTDQAAVIEKTAKPEIPTEVTKAVSDLAKTVETVAKMTEKITVMEGRLTKFEKTPQARAGQSPDGDDVKKADPAQTAGSGILSAGQK